MADCGLNLGRVLFLPALIIGMHQQGKVNSGILLLIDMLLRAKKVE